MCCYVIYYRSLIGLRNDVTVAVFRINQITGGSVVVRESINNKHFNVFSTF